LSCRADYYTVQHSLILTILHTRRPAHPSTSANLPILSTPAILPIAAKLVDCFAVAAADAVDIVAAVAAADAVDIVAAVVAADAVDLVGETAVAAVELHVGAEPADKWAQSVAEARSPRIVELPAAAARH
jgi:hypothetical protein